MQEEISSHGCQHCNHTIGRLSHKNVTYKSGAMVIDLSAENMMEIFVPNLSFLNQFKPVLKAPFSGKMILPMKI